VISLLNQLSERNNLLTFVTMLPLCSLHVLFNYQFRQVHAISSVFSFFLFLVKSFSLCILLLLPFVVNKADHKQPLRSTQRGHSCVGRHSEYHPMAGDAPRLRSKNSYHSCLEAGKHMIAVKHVLYLRTTKPEYCDGFR